MPRYAMPRLSRFFDRHLGGTNLEVFKFGMYILFPVAWMYYFGTNLDGRFSTPEFWPKAGETHRIPFEREEMAQEIERLRNRRLMLRERRLAAGHAADGQVEETGSTAQIRGEER